MQLNELLEKDGINKVSNVTNISSNNLNYLADKNFEKLIRVKALGFLLILEIEYSELNLGDLRKEVKLYFEENKPLDENVVMVSKESVEGGDFSFFKWFIILALIAGGWYFYSQGKLDGLLKNIEDKKDFFDDTKALESNVTEEEAQKVTINQEKSEPIAIITPLEPTEKKITLIENEQNKTVKNEEKHIILEESNSSRIVSVKALSTEEIVKEVVKSAEEKVEKTRELVANESNKIIVEEKTISTITINPTRGALWYGFINIDTKKRREFMKKVSTPFDIDNGRWLLVTGHGYVDIISDLETIEMTDSKKHYFYLDSKEIKVLTQEKFRELNGNRGW